MSGGEASDIDITTAKQGGTIKTVPDRGRLAMKRVPRTGRIKDPVIYYPVPRSIVEPHTARNKRELVGKEL